MKIESSHKTKDNRTNYILEKRCIYCDSDNSRYLEKFHVHLRDPVVDTVVFYLCSRCGNTESKKEIRKSATRLFRSSFCGRDYKKFVPHFKDILFQ